jgi:competence ComEA-like helix-hairpin-helix protein
MNANRPHAPGADDWMNPARRIALVTGAAAIIAVAASFCSVAAQNPPDKKDDPALPDGPGKAIIKKTCSPCHTASVITTKPGRTDDEWEEVLNTMIGRGAVLSDEDGDTLMEYLSTNFGPSWKGKPLVAEATAESGKTAPPSEAATANAAATINVNKASAQELQAALGITANEAQLIVSYREQKGNFKTWEEVSSVPGVTSDKIKENQKRLTF